MNNINNIIKYLGENTYRYKIYSMFEKDGNLHVIVSEFNPNNEQSKMYFLYEKNGKIYNDNDELLN